MTRPLKFRAWRKVKKTMSTPFQFRNIKSGIDWDTLIVMQYTRLKDENGKEIYEGDMVRSGFDFWEVKFGKTSYEKSKLGGEVFERNLAVGFYLLNINKGIEDPIQEDLTSIDWTTGESVEVIGNIYETPELLKEHQG